VVGGLPAQTFNGEIALDFFLGDPRLNCQTSVSSQTHQTKHQKLQNSAKKRCGVFKAVYVDNFKNSPAQLTAVLQRSTLPPT